MNDDLEPRLRDAFRRRDLPPAPESLHALLSELPAQRRSRRSGRAWALLAAALVLVGGAALVGGGLSGPAPRPSTEPSRAASSTSLPASFPPAPAGFARFAAPGINFVYPATWSVVTPVDQPMPVGARLVAAFVGPTDCAGPVGRSPAPSTPACASLHGAWTGVSVIEYLHQYPGSVARTMTKGGFPEAQVGGYQAWVRPIDPGDAPTGSVTWVIAGPDDGMYVLAGQTTKANHVSRQADLAALAASIELWSWQSPPAADAGPAHVGTGQGFSLDYPASWAIYYPQEVSMMDSPAFTVASRPVLPPCSTDACGDFTPAAGSAVVAFRVGGLLGEPRWEDATETVGGQPALRQTWTPASGTGVDEGYSLTVRLGDRQALGIYVSLRGPDLPALRSTVQDLLRAVVIPPIPTPTP